jgi:hypothetical protein
MELVAIRKTTIAGAGLADAANALQEALRAAGSDLQRLDALLADAVATLVESFSAVRTVCGQQPEIAIPLERAATALQFQDLASQLIEHNRRRFESAWRIGEELGRLDASLAAGKTPAAALAEAGERFAGCAHALLANGVRQPVRQQKLDAGSVELF